MKLAAKFCVVAAMTFLSSFVCSGNYSQGKAPRILVFGQYVIRLSYESVKISEGDWQTWWGTGPQDKTYSVLSRISGTYHGKPLRVHRSAWSGIADLDSATVTRDAAGCTVHCLGSDAGSSF